MFSKANLLFKALNHLPKTAINHMSKRHFTEEQHKISEICEFIKAGNIPAAKKSAREFGSESGETYFAMLYSVVDTAKEYQQHALATEIEEMVRKFSKDQEDNSHYLGSKW